MPVPNPIRWLSLLHRWLGTCLCLMFTVWFATGAVLLFVPFPSLPDNDRVTRSQPIDFGAIKISPEMVADRFGQTIDRLRIIQAGPDPVYLVGQIGGGTAAISARSGERLDSI